MDELNQLRPFSPDVNARLRTNLLPDRIVASLNMEGITATRRQTLAVMDAMRIKESIGKGQREILNALMCDEFIIDAVDRGVSVNESLVREINRLLLQDIDSEAGQFRTINVELPGAPFLPPEPTEVPSLVARLCEVFSLSESLHPIVQAA